MRRGRSPDPRPPPPGLRQVVVAAGVSAAAGVFAAACANEMPPPGALPDRLPPTVERITPAPDSVVPGFDGRLEIRFDEPVNVPQDLPRRMLASPFQVYEMETGFSSIRLRPRDGWRDSVVYCLEIPEGITDLLRNRTVQSTAFCFSTGAPIADTEVIGTVLDAVTGQALADASVVFLAPPDSIPYGATTRGDGRFRLRAIPPGPYDAFGFADQNRNLVLDRALEPHDSTTLVIAEGARPDLEFRIVAPDTTPPVMLRVDAVDERTIRLEFDDPLLRPQEGDPRVTVQDSTSGLDIEVWAVRVGEPATVSFPVDSAALAADSVAADTARVVAPDSLPAAVDPAAAGPPAPDAAADLPSRFVSVRLRPAIVSGTYRVSASGFVNLRRLTGGGDTTFVARIEVPADSAGVSADSLGAPQDTVGAVRDTLAVRVDTLRVGLTRLSASAGREEGR